jgi:hypothetical protein
MEEFAKSFGHIPQSEEEKASAYPNPNLVDLEPGEKKDVSYRYRGDLMKREMGIAKELNPDDFTDALKRSWFELEKRPRAQMFASTLASLFTETSPIISKKFYNEMGKFLKKVDNYVPFFEIMPPVDKAGKHFVEEKFFSREINLRETPKKNMVEAYADELLLNQFLKDSDHEVYNRHNIRMYNYGCNNDDSTRYAFFDFDQASVSDLFDEPREIENFPWEDYNWETSLKYGQLGAMINRRAFFKVDTKVFLEASAKEEEFSKIHEKFLQLQSGEEKLSLDEISELKEKYKTDRIVFDFRVKNKIFNFKDKPLDLKATDFSAQHEERVLVLAKLFLEDSINLEKQEYEYLKELDSYVAELSRVSGLSLDESRAKLRLEINNKIEEYRKPEKDAFLEKFFTYLRDKTKLIDGLLNNEEGHKFTLALCKKIGLEQEIRGIKTFKDTLLVNPKEKNLNVDEAVYKMLLRRLDDLKNFIFVFMSDYYLGHSSGLRQNFWQDDKACLEFRKQEFTDLKNELWDEFWQGDNKEFFNDFQARTQADALEFRKERLGKDSPAAAWSLAEERMILQ